jgi:large subunit ribosomal protein L25
MTVILPVEARAKVLDSKDKTRSYISAVVYGPKFASTAIRVDKQEFEKTFKKAGESTIIELQGLSSPVDVLVKEVVFSPIKGGIVHVDFYALEKGKEITTNIQLHFINESPAEKLGAVVNKVLHEVEVVCKPNDLPSHIDVDLGLLVTTEDKIHISDIVAPKGVKITQDASDVVALAEAVVEEVVEEAPVIAAADVPAEKKGKTEEAAAE